MQYIVNVFKYVMLTCPHWVRMSIVCAKQVHVQPQWFHTSLFYETCQYTIQNVLQSCLAAEGFEDIRTFLFALHFASSPNNHLQ